ncbi:MAG: DUF4157 domain-containing protein [Acetobacteraceae bacterium]
MRRSMLLAGLSWALPVRAEPQVAPALTEYAAGLLARMVQSAREQAIADGVRPVPPAIYRGLLGFFPPALLQRARFASGRGSGVMTLPSLAFTYGDAAAVTLGDVVLFRDERAAQTDLKLWAHELTHVMQYQRLGMDGFAAAYVRDHAALEKEARETAVKFMTWHDGQRHRSA